MCKNVCIVYNEPRPGLFEAAGEKCAVASVLDAVESVTEAVSARGCSVHAQPIRFLSSSLDRCLQELNPQLVFNLFEGFDGEPESEGKLARILECRGIPVTEPLLEPCSAA